MKQLSELNHVDPLVDKHWMTEAYYLATRSPDPSTQNGAVIVRYGVKVGAGFNDFPTGVDAGINERWERPTKYSFVEHAERNAVFHAAYFGMPTREATMYCAWAPCSDCARAIIQAGLSELVTHDHPAHRGESGTTPTWQASIDTGLLMLSEAGVKYRQVEGAIGNTIRFNGKLVKV